MVKGFLSGLEIVTSGMDSLTKKGTSFFSDIIEGQGGKTIADGLYGVLEDAFSGLGDTRYGMDIKLTACAVN